MSASFNKVLLIGRLTRDPEVLSMKSGGKVAKFGFAVSERYKDSATGEWGERPIWLDCEAWNSEGRKLADLIEKYLKKGSLIHIEGRLKLDQWEDKNGGGKRQAIRIRVEFIQFLDKKEDDGTSDGASGQKGYNGGSAKRSYQTTTRAIANKPTNESDWAPPATTDDDDLPF